MLGSTLKRRLRPYRHWLYAHAPRVAGWLDRRLTPRRFLRLCILLI